MNTGASSFVRLSILLGTLIAVRAHGQQSIAFCNACLPSPPDRLVRDVNGNPLVGTNYLAQLYYGSTPDTLVAHTTQPARFRIAITTLPGTWTSGNRTVVSPSPGPFILQVRVWDIAAGATYEQASQNTLGLQYGKSVPFTYEPCPIPSPPNCDKMMNFRGFTLVTNSPPDPGTTIPPDRMLVIRENGNMVDVVYSGTHTIQAAPTLRGPWTTIHSGVGPYADPSSSDVRFYRMRDEPGPMYSLNAVGYYRLSLCNGYSLIANQLNADGGNSVTNLFKSPAEGTRILKFDPVTGGFATLEFSDGEWQGGNLEMTLNPGEGAYLRTTMTSHRFVGEVAMLATIPIPTGFSLISNPLAEAGPVDLLPPNGMGLPVRDGTAIYQWNCATQDLVVSQFGDGQWEPGGSTVGPTVGIGEAFYFYNPGPSMAWARSFTVGP